MIGLPTGTSIWIAAGFTDLRRGFTGLSGMVQTTLQENPFSGHVFVFRGRRGDLIKMLWWDGERTATSLAVSRLIAADRVSPTSVCHTKWCKRQGQLSNEICFSHRFLI